MKCIEDEIPFELPGGWAWSRLVSLSSVITDGEHKTPRRINEFQGYYLLSARNIQNGFLSLTDVDFVDKIEFENISKRCNPKDNDVLISCSGSIGRVTVVNNGNDYVMVRSAAMVRPIGIDPYYLMFALQSGQIQTQMQKASKQTAQANLFLGAIQSLLIPVPPLSEQIRIAKKLSNIWTHVQQIDVESETVSNIISKVKSKILDLAIRGQLVPQDPADEPASVLLERIRAEKEELIKQGKIRRDKKESVIFRGEDNSYYFDIPDNWSLCPLKELFNVCSAKRVRQSDWRTEGVPFYRAREIVKLSDNGFVDNDLFISEEHYMRVKTECGVPEPGDLMVSGVGTIGKIYVVNSNDRFYYKDASVLCFENRTGAIDSQFARYMLESEFVQAQMKDNSKGTTVDTITISAAMEYICVLPPLAEQKRIVSAIKTAFMHLECISEALT